jgi:uncharacterized repeat protein (TIGR03803 family)
MFGKSRTLTGKLLRVLALPLSTHAVTHHAAAQTAAALYTFTNSPSAGPAAAVVIGKNGNLFGTTMYLGAFGDGSVYELSPPTTPGQPWTEKTLYSFTGQNGDGQSPVSDLVVGPGGIFYGTTLYGGGNLCIEHGCGTVFQLTPPAAPDGTWTETVIYSFTGQGGDGFNPESGLIMAPDGVLYGTTSGGGLTTSACPYSCGTVFQLSPPMAPGGAWKERILYHFTGQGGDGASPWGSLVLSGGVLYGTTLHGGSGTCDYFGQSGCGTVFELSQPTTQGGAWTEKVLHEFTGFDSDGASPVGGVIVEPGGVLYGTTAYGGANECGLRYGSPGCGAVFQLTPPAMAGSAWTESLLYSFKGLVGCCFGDGATPMAPVTFGPDGTLYGTTYNGGEPCTTQDTIGCGTVFWLTPPAAPGGAWSEATISLLVQKTGVGPLGALVMGPHGTLYGTTSGDLISYGTVFALLP